MSYPLQCVKMGQLGAESGHFDFNVFRIEKVKNFKGENKKMGKKNEKLTTKLTRSELVRLSLSV